MKYFLVLLSFLFFTSTANAIYICGFSVTSVSVTGPVSYSNGEIDFSEACVTFTGTVDICSSPGNTLASVSFTAYSDGCDGNNSNLDIGNTGTKFKDFEDIFFSEEGNFNNKVKMDIPIAYPNPTRDGFNINTQDIDKLYLFNSEGHLVKEINTKSDGITTFVNTSNLKAGTYFLKSGKNSKTSFSQAIIVH